MNGVTCHSLVGCFLKKEKRMGFIVFVIIISLLIVSEARSIIKLKTADVVSEEPEDYFDDFETL